MTSHANASSWPCKLCLSSYDPGLPESKLQQTEAHHAVLDLTKLLKVVPEVIVVDLSLHEQIHLSHFDYQSCPSAAFSNTKQQAPGSCTDRIKRASS